MVANESKGLTEAQPKAVEQQPEALPIPDRNAKKKPEQRTSPEKPRTPPPEDNRVPFGQGGPVSGPNGVFTASNVKGGFSFTGAMGDFGSKYGWYVEVVQRKGHENWTVVAPPISSPRRLYIVFEILSGGKPPNIKEVKNNVNAPGRADGRVHIGPIFVHLPLHYLDIPTVLAAKVPHCAGKAKSAFNIACG